MAARTLPKEADTQAERTADVTSNYAKINAQIQPLLASGDYAGAFAAANATGQLDAFTNPQNIKTLFPSALTQQQLTNFYQAFQPYEQQAAGKLTGQFVSPSLNAAYGGQQTTWGSGIDPVNAAKENYNSIFGGIPELTQFEGTHQRNSSTFINGIENIAEYAVLPVVTAAVGGGALGAGASAAETAAVGAGLGAAQGAIGADLNGGNAWTGALKGAAGGAVAGGGGQYLSGATGLNPALAGTIAKTAGGAITGGASGAAAGAVGGAAGYALNAAGLPSMVAGFGGKLAGNYAASLFQSPINGSAGAGTVATQAGIAQPSTLMDSNQGMTPTGTQTSGGTASTDNSWLSQIGSYLSGNGANIAEFGALAGLGLEQANSQKNTNDQLAGSLSSLGTPFNTSAQTMLTGTNAGLGGSIGQQTSAAASLGDIANTNINAYKTNTLLPGQQSQVDDYIKQQRAMVDSQLAASGNTDGSAKDAAYQQIDSNAALLTQQLNQNNLTAGETALSTVQSTYTNLINQTLSEANFGFGAQSTAVQTQIASDTQLSTSLNQLFAGIAQGFGAAQGGAKSGATGTSQVGKVANGVASTAAGGLSSSIAAMLKGGSGVPGSVGDTSTNGQINSSYSNQAGADSFVTDYESNMNSADASGTGVTSSLYDNTPEPYYDFGAGDPWGDYGD